MALILSFQSYLQFPKQALFSFTCPTFVHVVPMPGVDHPLPYFSQGELTHLSSLCSREPFLTILSPCKAMLTSSLHLPRPQACLSNAYHTCVIDDSYVCTPPEAVSSRRAKVVCLTFLSTMPGI